MSGDRYISDERRRPERFQTQSQARHGATTYSDRPSFLSVSGLNLNLLLLLVLFTLAALAVAKGKLLTESWRSWLTQSSISTLARPLPVQANQCHESLDYRLMFGGQSQLVAGNTRVVLSEPAASLDEALPQNLPGTVGLANTRPTRGCRRISSDSIM